MIVKAMENFSGKVSMSIGQVRDIPEGETLPDLLHKELSKYTHKQIREEVLSHVNENE